MKTDLSGAKHSHRYGGEPKKQPVSASFDDNLRKSNQGHKMNKFTLEVDDEEQRMDQT